MVLDINKTRSHPLSTDISYISQVQEIQGFAVIHLPVVSESLLWAQCRVPTPNGAKIDQARVTTYPQYHGQPPTVHLQTREATEGLAVCCTSYDVAASRAA